MIAAIGHCGRVRCEPGWSLAPVWSRRLKDHDLWYVWAGRGRMTLRDRRTIDLRPGVMIWARPGGTYVATQDPGDRLGVTFIHFTPEPALSIPDDAMEVRDPGYVDAVTRRVIELHETDGDAVALPLLGALAVDLASGRGTRAESRGGTEQRHEQAARSIASELREHPDRPTDIAALAERVGYSPDHLTKIFTEVIGTTPSDYAIEQRLNRARALLDETPMTVGRIAEVLGYDSAAYFCRQFKQRTGLTPGQYRRNPL